MLAAPAQRSLILFPGSLGDFVCFLPTLRLLSRATPVHLLARSEFADLVPASVTVRSLEQHEISRLFVPGSSQEQRLRDFFAPYGSILSWTGSGNRTFLQQLESVSEGRARVFPFQPVGIRIHQADYYLACVGGQSQESSNDKISLKPEAVAWSDDYWRQHCLDGKRVLALAPGSGARQKNWPDRAFQSVGNWWRRRRSGAAIFIVGPVEEDKRDYIALSRGAVVARQLRLGQLAALLARSDLYVGNDSGVTHLAAALGVSTLALFGPSDVRRWTPRGPSVTVLSRKVPCSPCTVPVMKSCAHRSCLTTLETSEVIEGLEQLAKGIAAC